MLRSFVLWLLSFLPHTVIEREPGVPYLTRYYLLGRRRGTNRKIGAGFNIFLHCFHISDEPTPHNHPWSGKSLILKGSYFERRMIGPYHVGFTYNPGDWNRLEPDTFHYVTLKTPEVWTLFFAGRRVQNWGFQDPARGFVVWNEYKAKKAAAQETPEPMSEWARGVRALPW